MYSFFSFPQKNSSSFERVLLSHYSSFNPSPPHFAAFDVSSCVPAEKRIFLRITVDGELNLVATLFTAHTFLLGKNMSNSSACIAFQGAIRPFPHLHATKAGAFAWKKGEGERRRV